MVNKKPSEQKQRVAADILTSFMFCENIADVFKEWDKIFEDYQLCRDVFTGCPCSQGDYFKGQTEYEKQVMIDKYGHCDGLE